MSFAPFLFEAVDAVDASVSNPQVGQKYGHGRTVLDAVPVPDPQHGSTGQFQLRVGVPYHYDLRRLQVESRRVPLFCAAMMTEEDGVTTHAGDQRGNESIQ